MYYRTGVAISKWEPKLNDQDSWAEAERAWIRIHSGNKLRAVCGVYMRTNDSVNSEFYAQNEKLYSILQNEMSLLRSQGYSIGFMGDFNAWIKASRRFSFKNYPHQENNNGRLFAQFVEDNNLFCLNPMKWRGRQEEKFTYQREMGARRHKSIIDYVVATEDFIATTVDMKVSDHENVSVDSDHSTLVLSYNSKSLRLAPALRPVNIYKKIRHWNSFKDVLDKMLSSKMNWFQEQTVEVQGSWLTAMMKQAGRSVLPTLKCSKPGLAHRVKGRKSSYLSRQAKRARKKLRAATNSRASAEVMEQLAMEWQQAQLLAAQEESSRQFISKLRIRRIIAKKGTRGSRLFWQCVKGARTPVTTIEVLDSGKGLEFEVEPKNKIIEDFLETKFKTTDSPPVRSEEFIPEEKIGLPPLRLTNIQSGKVMRSISMKELNAVLDTLDIQKAEGPDDITNNMLRNSGSVTRTMILELFNNVLIGGVNPAEWKVGNVILTLKRSPDTDISNYRPITLISCLSKVLSKMIAQRISEAVEESKLAGDLQNGFRKDRGCSDNIFILNSLLELNRERRRLSFIMFVDLQEVSSLRMIKISVCT